MEGGCAEKAQSKWDLAAQPTLLTDWLSESREWAEIPATFRCWPDYEDRAATIRTWNPGILGGLVQSEDYARALIAVQPGVTAEIMAGRLAARAERQRRVLDRQDNPPSVWVIVG